MPESIGGSEMCEVFKLTNKIIKRSIEEPNLSLANELIRMARALALAARHFDEDNPVFVRMNNICAGKE